MRRWGKGRGATRCDSKCWMELRHGLFIPPTDYAACIFDLTLCGAVLGCLVRDHVLTLFARKQASDRPERPQIRAWDCGRCLVHVPLSRAFAILDECTANASFENPPHVSGGVSRPARLDDT